VQGNACQDNKIWLWTAVDHFKTGILGWVLGGRRRRSFAEHSAKTFATLWKVVGQWKCHFYVTDGWKVYPKFIPEVAQIISKTYMTKVEGENTRLRHYLARAISFSGRTGNGNMPSHCLTSQKTNDLTPRTETTDQAPKASKRA
jgi:IS1 family transposase